MADKMQKQVKPVVDYYVDVERYSDKGTPFIKYTKNSAQRVGWFCFKSTGVKLIFRPIYKKD